MALIRRELAGLAMELGGFELGELEEQARRRGRHDAVSTALATVIS